MTTPRFSKRWNCLFRHHQLRATKYFCPPSTLTSRKKIGKSTLSLHSAFDCTSLTSKSKRFAMECPKSFRFLCCRSSRRLSYRKWFVDHQTFPWVFSRLSQPTKALTRRLRWFNGEWNIFSLINERLERLSVARFWEVMEEFTNQERSLFLRFVWGRTRLPRNIADFRGRDFVLQGEKFTESSWNSCSIITVSLVLDKYNPADHFLPESYTFFFLLKMPRYSCKVRIIFIWISCNKFN